MKQFLILLVLMVGSCLGASAKEQLSYGLDAGFSNRYTWRGVSYNHGLVFQPNAFVKVNNLTFNAWSNVTVWDINNEKLNELDLSVIYGLSFWNIYLDASLNYFHYFEYPSSNTVESVFNANYPLGDFSVFNIFSLDLLNIPGAFYNELGFDYSYTVNRVVKLYGKAIVGYASKMHNNENHELNYASFNYLGTGAKAMFEIYNQLSVDVYYQQNFFVNSELKSRLNSNSSYLELILKKRF